MTAARLFLGLALDEAGQRGAAVKAFDAVLDEDAEAGAEFEELCLMGDALLDWALPERAARCPRRALALPRPAELPAGSNSIAGFAYLPRTEPLRCSERLSKSTC